MPSSCAPAAPRRRLVWAGAIVVTAACGRSSESADPRAADSANAAAAGAPAPTTTSTPGDSASSSVVTQSVPPTAGDRSVAGRDSGGPASTNRSGMPTTGGTPTKQP